MRSIVLLALAGVLLAGNAISQEPLRPLKISETPVIDGVLSETFWQQTPMVDDFETFSPDFGKKQEQRTEVRMAYDAENLYYAFTCFDDPSLVKNSMSSRDNIRSDDWVCINLDTYGDHQSLYAIYINPNGIQMDSRFAGGNEDFNADIVFYSVGRMTADGYIVEVGIPLKSIRYADDDPVTMTVFFERYISRTAEHGSYPPLDPAKGYNFLTQMAPMVYEGLEHYTLLEVLPAVVFSEQRSHRNGTFSVSDVRRDASLTAKYGITSNLTLDATYNPDFSQVEADAGQVDVNLRYNVFYPEKRPFFLEGREYFSVGGAGGVSPLQSLVHTRTIVDPLVGLKVSGKVGNENVVSLLYANDELGPVGSGLPSKANFIAARYWRVLSEDSYIGGIGATREYGNGYNRLGGIDGRIRVGADDMVGFHGIGSTFRADSGGPAINGHAVTVSYQKGDRDLEYGASYVDISKEFTAEMGYVSRTGVRTVSAYINPLFYPASGMVNRVQLVFSSIGTLDRFSDRWEMLNTAGVNIVHFGNLVLSLQGNIGNEIFAGQRFDVSYLYAVWGGQLTRWLGVTLNARAGNAIFYSPNPFAGSAQRYFARLTFQPYESLALEYSLTYAQFKGDSTSASDFSYPINRVKFTYQVNRYLFLRWITEYNGFRKRLPTDFLVSFTYIPGTVLHVGYGMIHQRVAWDPAQQLYRQSDRFLQTNTGLFFKASYLWRL